MIKPLEAIKSTLAKVDEVVASTRMETCKSCSEFKASMSICKQCGCYMPLKSRSKNLPAPLVNGNTPVLTGKYHDSHCKTSHRWFDSFSFRFLAVVSDDFE